jgi:23S rRNA (cytidine1920-2'-O)/16S rRNA (cytidine1409-2'-O)-methyltransferase
MVEGGHVLVAGAPADKASRLVASGEPLLVTASPPKYVGRGGSKLEAALSHFGVDPSGRTVLDAGASTGGFTDCLLQHGAASVVSVDVGRGQLHDRLRRDSRVEHLERTDIRDYPVSSRLAPFDLVVADLSFISLRAVAAALVALSAGGGDLLVLVKPQFEAGRAEVSRGRGVIRDPEVWRRALSGVVSAFALAGACIMGIMVSPLRGADGNVEFFAHLRAGERSEGAALDADEAIGEAVRRAAQERSPG